MEPGSMSVKEVTDLLFAARGRIDFYWNFYVVVVIAVIGWLVSLKKKLTLSMKLLVSVAYLIAAVMNFLGLYSAYTFAEALRTDLLRMASPLTDTRALLEQHSYLPQRPAALAVHLVIGVIILLVIWFARFTDAEPATTQVASSKPESEGSHEKRTKV